MIDRVTMMSTLKNERAESVVTSKRSLLRVSAVLTLLPVWGKPMVDAVILPAHAQTSAAMCVTDMTVGGPLAGAPGNPATCQAACEAEATRLNAQLCEVRETTTASGTDCACDIDTP